MVRETSRSINERDVSILSILIGEWKVCAAGLVVGLVLIIEPQWAFAAMRYSSAMIYSLLLAVQS